MAPRTKAHPDETDHYGIERSHSDDTGAVDKVRERSPFIDHVMRMTERYGSNGGNQYAKMSKSGENPKGIVNLLDPPKTSAKRIKSAVTDDLGEVHFDREQQPGVSNLLVIQSALTGEKIENLVEKYAGKGYGHLKVDTADALQEFTTPLKQRYDELMEDQGELERILARGAEHATEIAQPLVDAVYDKVGFIPRPRR